MNRAHFRKDIQGLRAVAVLSVLLYHAYPAVLPGGFVGVDIFFVISGYVISRTILRDLTSGTFTIAEFYRRRVRRIFPALYGMLLVVLGASFIVIAPAELADLAKTTLATVLFVSNLYFMRHTGYFDGNSALKPLLHTWSLAVEEQFYVFYPLVLLVLYRLRASYIKISLLILAVASLGLSIWLLRDHPMASFYMAPSRAFELLLGCLAAQSGDLSNRTPRFRHFLSAAGGLLIVGSFFLLDTTKSFPGLAALAPSAGAFFLILAGSSGSTFLGSFLSIPAATAVGDLSYSLYLWHWPVLALARQYWGYDLSAGTATVCLLIAALASFLSYRLLERPILDKKMGHLPFLTAGTIAIVCLCAITLPLILRHGFPGRYSKTSQQFFQTVDDYNRDRKSCHAEVAGQISYDKTCVFGDTSAAPSVAVWGDSHGAELAAAVGENLKPNHESIREITASACPPSLNYKALGSRACQSHNTEVLEKLTSDGSIKTVVLTAEYDRYRNDQFSQFLEGFGAAISRLKMAGKRIVIVYPIPVQQVDPPSILGMYSSWGKPIDTIGISAGDYRKRNEITLAFLDKISTSADVLKVFPQDLFCNQSICPAYEPKIGVLYFNADHLSLTGARILAKALPL